MDLAHNATGARLFASKLQLAITLLRHRAAGSSVVSPMEAGIAGVGQ